MEDLNPVPSGGPSPFSQSSWEDMLNDLLQDPAGDEEAGLGEQVVDQGLLGLVDGSLEDLAGGEGGPYFEAWWSAAAPVDASLNQVDLSELGDGFILEDDDVALPGLCSEVSFLAEGNISSPDEPKTSSDAGVGQKRSRDAVVSSPGSCSRVEVEQDCAPFSISGDEAFVSSRSHSPIVTSCSDRGAASPDAGCDSSDGGAMGRSCDNFAEQSNRRDDKSLGDLDEDAKRQSRYVATHAYPSRRLQSIVCLSSLESDSCFLRREN